MTPSFSVVASNGPETLRQETVTQRVRRLQAEARDLARGHIGELTAAMEKACEIAADIAEGGEAYPAGVRDVARRFAEDCDTRIQLLQAIAGRA